MDCTYFNFNKEDFKTSVDFVQQLLSKDLDSLFEDIVSGLENVSFSLDINSSKNPDKYEDSIIKLIDFIKDKLSGKNKLQFEPERVDYSILTRRLRNKYLPTKLTKIDSEINAIIPSMGMLSQESLSTLKYKELVSEVYGDNFTILNFREQLMKQTLLLKTIIDVDNKRIIDSVSTLNKNLKDYKQSQYDILREFVRSIEVDGKQFEYRLFPKEYFDSDGNMKNGVLNVYSVMYNYLSYLRQQGSLQDYIQNGWDAKSKGLESKFFDALNAYFTLQFFDDCINQAFNGYISINLDFDEPVVIEDGKEIYKYSFEQKNKHMLRSWNDGDKFQDAIEQMAGFSKTIIETIPLKSFDKNAKTNIGAFLTINSVWFNNALINFRSAIEGLTSADTEYQDILYDSMNNPENLIKLMHKIFVEDKNFLQTLLDVKSFNDKPYLNTHDINILYSIYDTVFNPENPKSYYSIELNYKRESGGDKEKYFIIDSMLGLINSTAGMNYLELVWNNADDVKQYEIRIKRKYNIGAEIFELVRVINREVHTRRNKEDILASYPLKMSNQEKVATLTYSLSSGENIDVGVTFSNHILSKSDVARFNLNSEKTLNENLNLDPNINKIVDSKGKVLLDISTRAARESFFLSSISKNQELFMKMLDFIDNMLGTTFSKDTDGLLLLNEYFKQGGRFMDIYKTALRALEIIDIYNKLEKDGKYDRSQIKSFLKENPTVYDRDIYSNSNTERQYFTKDQEGEFLSVVNFSDTWVNEYTLAQKIVNGASSKSVTKNANNDNIPNSSPTYEGAEFLNYLSDARKANNSTSKLLFANRQNSLAIKSTIIDTDIKFRNGRHKSISECTESELLTHSIIDKFYLPLFNGKRKSVFILSTTFSDKTKYVGSEISLSDLGLEKLIFTRGEIGNVCEQMLFDSVGEYYQSIWRNVIEDYAKIFGSSDITFIESELNKIHDVKELVNKAVESGVTVYKDLHYREINGKLTINELLYHYATDLYANRDNLHSRLNEERVNFVNDLIDTRTSFTFDRDPESSKFKQKGDDPVGHFISEISSTQPNYINEWTEGNHLILGKLTLADGSVVNVDAAKIELQPGESFELNPFLESYFSVDVLLSNNLRYSLTGSEINHKIKGSYNIVKTLTSAGFDPIQFGIKPQDTIVAAMQKLKDITDPKLMIEALRAMKTIRDEIVYSREAGGQGALLKRNVIIPATMRHYLLNRINGVPPKMRAAIISDVKAYVQNFDGSTLEDDGKYGSDKIDSHDGFAHINPLMSILENNSLLDNEVGDMKKNILHSMDAKYGGATLFKYAAGAMTNNEMRKSEASPIKLREMFKKMSNERWSRRKSDGTIEWIFNEGGKESGEVDLTFCAYKKVSNTNDLRELNFTRDILDEKPLYYENRGLIYQITDFGRDEDTGDYYTIELEVNHKGDPQSESVKVYHYFDNEGNYLTSTEPILSKFKIEKDAEGNDVEVEALHTIDSLYELWSVMGGINSMEFNGENFVPSEASLYATTKFINFASNERMTKDDANIVKDEVSLRTYDQPLKRAFIAYLVNDSAIKNGAGNMNPVTSYYDNAPLTTITIDTKGHGVLLDADHHADEALMTEFSLVITSLDAGGRMHDYVKQIYNTLGLVALKLSGVELEAVKAFDESGGNKSKIYDLIGRTIIKNMKEGQKGLLKAIMSEVKKEFNANTDHIKDVFKIPFSDPNVYSLILATFVSIINKKSIKRQYPGSGMVMIPAYDIHTVFDYNGLIYQYQDLIDEARFKLSYEEKASIVASNNMDYNRELVKLLLQKEQGKYIPTTKTDWINPAQNVNIYLDTSTTEVKPLLFEGLIKLDKGIADYYDIKSDKPLVQRKFLAEKLYKVKISDWHEGKEWTDKNKVKHRNQQVTIKIDGDKDFKGYFVIQKDIEDNFWTIHMKTGLKGEYGQELVDENNQVIPDPAFTPEYKQRLFAAAALLIPKGDYLSTYGSVTTKGVNGLKRFENLGFIDTKKTRTVTDRQGLPMEIPIYQSNIDIKFLKNVTESRNLAPSEITFEVEGKKMNMFDHWAIKNIYLEGKRDLKQVLRAFDLLNQGKYEKAEYNEDLKKYVSTGEIVEISNLVNKEAECIVPNIYQSKFNLSSNLSLVSILNSNDAFFNSPSPIHSENYDMVFTKNNGRHTYLSFCSVPNNSDTYESQIIEWDDIISEDFDSPDSTIVHKMYAVNKDNIKLFEIGRKQLITDGSVKWDLELKAFVDKNNIPVANQNLYERYNDLVLEKIFFIQKRKVKEKIKDKTKSYTLYTINYAALKDVYDKKSVDDTSYNKYLGKIISAIYDSDDYNGLQLNTTMTLDSANTIRKSITEFARRQSHNKALHNLLIGENGEGGYMLYLKSAYIMSKNREEKQRKIEEEKQKNPDYQPEESTSNNVFKISKAKNKALLNNYEDNLVTQIKTSFLKSLYFTASRIPAQSHLSFMKMKAVGFTGGDVTHTYVSHFLTWLQGSDYDIDKAYMMGMSFNGNGKYVGWSNLFDYSSLKTLEASEYLPMPSKTKYTENKTNGFYIQDKVKKLNKIITKLNEIENLLKDESLSDEAKANLKLHLGYDSLKSDRILWYADLLNTLQKEDVSEIMFTNENSEKDEEPKEDILHYLDEHEFSNIPDNMLELACKNFISSHILNTVLNLTNMIGAYTPITMETLRGSSKNSPKGAKTAKMTLLNPATKYLMLYLNMVGKDVIGISATGIKGSFTWHYYMNEILQNNLGGRNSELIKRAKFKFITDRIVGRAKAVKANEERGGKGVPENFNGRKEIEAIPDINWDKLSDETKKLLFDGNVDENVLIGAITVDLLQSLVLSAATDNAKELILYSINAGTKLAKCYLFMLTMGYDLNDIVSFMTSPIISAVDKLTENNGYTNLSLGLNDAITMIEGFKSNPKDENSPIRHIPKKLIYLLTTEKLAKKITKNKKLMEQLDEAFVKNDFSGIVNPERKIDKYNFDELIYELKKLRNVIPSFNESNMKDLANFKTILEGADEFSNFGRLLGINQGLKTVEKKFEGYLDFIRDIIGLRERALKLIDENGNINTEKAAELGIDNITVSTEVDGKVLETSIIGKFNINKWLKDEDYKNKVREYYSKIKVTIPIFDIIEEIPLFRSAYQLLDVSNTINRNIALRTKIVSEISEHFPSNFWDEPFRVGLSNAVFAKFIQLFMLRSNLQFPYKAEFNQEGLPTRKMVSNDIVEIPINANGLINFNSISDFLSFKYIFENQIIPDLKNGTYTKYVNGEFVTVENDQAIKANNFIQGLVSGEDRDLPLYKVNVDMLNYDATPESTMKMLKYVLGLLELSKVPATVELDENGDEVVTTTLADWFMIYNLYTNHNQYGSSRLTTLFDNFIDNKGKSFIMRDFFNFVGKLDYTMDAQYMPADKALDSKIRVYGDEFDFTLDVLDLFMLAATTTNNTFGKGNPIYKVPQTVGAIYEVKVGNKFETLPNQFFIADNVNARDKLILISTYLTIGGIASKEKETLINNLLKFDEGSKASLALLMLSNFLQILKICQ